VTLLSTLEARLEEVLQIPDLVSRDVALKILGDDVEELRAQVRRERSRVARALKDEGRSWREVGELLGISAARAESLGNQS
jgi:hypothetical protein